MGSSRRPLAHAREAAARLAVDAAGWVDGARRLDSPNCDPRPPGTPIELLLIHGISLPPGQFGGGHIERFFTNRLAHDEHPYFATLRGLRVSAHFLIARDGSLTQFVGCNDRAWHAGDSQFEGRQRCNDFSVGVELEGCDEQPYSERQYQVLASLARALFAAYRLRAVRGHSDVAPGRKTDPGPAFDWQRLMRDLNTDPAAFAPELFS